MPRPQRSRIADKLPESLELYARNCAVSIDLMTIYLTTFLVYVSEYFHHVLTYSFGLRPVLGGLVLVLVSSGRSGFQWHVNQDPLLLS